jgi:hypothetical protein
VSEAIMPTMIVAAKVTEQYGLIILTLPVRPLTLFSLAFKLFDHMMRVGSWLPAMTALRTPARACTQ